MTTKQKWIIGILLLVLVVGIFIAVFATGKDKTPPVVITTTTLPAYCNPNKPGYGLDGRPDPFCGKPLPPYLSECDPNNKGYDMYGFADPINCGFGRVKQ